MAENNKNLVLIILGALVAVAALVLVALFVIGGEGKPAPVARKAAATPEPEEDVIDIEDSEEGSKEEVELFSDFNVEEGALLGDVAAMANVYGDAGRWWDLFKANSDKIDYLFRDDDGNWRAIVRKGVTLKIPRGEEAATSDEEKERLISGSGVFTVQVTSFVNADYAKSVIEELEDGGEDAYISEYVVDDIMRTRVRVGFYWNEKLARKAGERLYATYESVNDFYVVIPTSREVREQNARLLKKYR